MFEDKLAWNIARTKACGVSFGFGTGSEHCCCGWWMAGCMNGWGFRDGFGLGGWSGRVDASTTWRSMRLEVCKAMLRSCGFVTVLVMKVVDTNSCHAVLC